MIVAMLPLFLSTATAQTTVAEGVITTAVPFLRIIPDARSGAMGDVGIAMSPDANSMFLNPSRLAFSEEDYGVGISYTPWLTNLKVNDIYMAAASGFFKIDDQQALGASVKYFNLGAITFTDESGFTLGDFRPNEFAIDAHYARKLSEVFGVAVSLRFIYSDLASDFTAGGEQIKKGTAGAGDISLLYRKGIELGEMNSKLNVGLNISNIGSKITYTESAVKDFIPTNLGLGVGWELQVDEANEIAIYTDFNKYLVPTPTTDDDDGNGVEDYKEKSPISAIFSSFGDAPGGFSEELKEITIGAGVEYWYDRLLAVRAGYFHENAEKGNRKYMTVGLGVRYNVFGLDISYLVPTSSQNHPLDNTLRFTLVFNFNTETPEEIDN